MFHYNLYIFYIYVVVVEFYNAINGETSKLKADKSVFTIADGIVQHLLVNSLYGDKFNEVVGEEEDSSVNITVRPYTVEDLAVPAEFYELIDITRTKIETLSEQLNEHNYKGYNVFIDPIDGTREFSTNLGEQCSICIGFAESVQGKPVAGLVYRPITTPPTWAAGAASENVTMGELDMATTPTTNGYLTSNGGISKFILNLMAELQYTRVPSGGAGNKMLMLLEGKGNCYIQDRGVSRWDTCWAQAVIEAYGGILMKLSPFIKSKGLESYTYKKSSLNLDFEAGCANLTAYNVNDKSIVKKGEVQPATDINQMKPYSNLCGLLALDKNSSTPESIETVYSAIMKAQATNAASYD